LRTRAGRYYSARATGELAPPASPQLTGIGEALREARETRGISHATAERETHIPRHHLQALEEERFEAFHAPVYVRGFLRSYSQYLGLDSTALLELLPPDSPLEDERLLPLSRLGRPRGPREAAQARRDPAERDAPPLTPAFQRPGSEDLARYPDSEVSGRLRLGFERRVLPDTATGGRMDPLGRLGWPEQADGGSELEEAWDTEAFLAPQEQPVREEFSKPSWDEPLLPRRSVRWQTTGRRTAAIPQDVLPLFRPYPLMLCAGGFALILVLLVVALIAFGGDGDPQVFATGIAPGAAAIAIRPPAGQPAPHGSMPDVQGTDLKTALATLRGSGIVPIVVVGATTDAASAHVSAQAPAAGSVLGSETPTLIVVGSPN
jgi:cytoskeleton protein RodZ